MARASAAHDLNVAALERFAVQHRLGPSHAHVVGMVLPRSLEVAGGFDGDGVTWRAFKGLLPGGVRGFVAHVAGAGGRSWELVRARVTGPTPVPELDVHVGGREPLASPFLAGHPRRVPVGRGARLRVAGDAPADARDASASAIRSWLDATGRRWNAELTEGWLTVFTVDREPLPDPPYDELCHATADLLARFSRQ